MSWSEQNPPATDVILHLVVPCSGGGTPARRSRGSDLLRAPGLMGADVRPFHGIADIVEQRTTFALRQQRICP